VNTTPPSRPLNVLFSVRPYRGHLYPLVPLARAFYRAGHRVAVATSEDVAQVITAAGLAWVPTGVNPRDVWYAFPEEDPDYGYSVIASKVADIVDLALESFPADVIISEPTDLAPSVATEVLGALNVTCGVGKFISVASWRSLGADQSINAVRRDYGLPDDPDLDSRYRGLYLSMLPPALEEVHPLPVPAVQDLRYVPWNGDNASDAAGRLPGSDGRPGVLVTLGTVYNTNSSLYSRILEALGDEPVRVICTLGYGAEQELAVNAPANVWFERYLPHSAILPSCQVTLCHAGINTVLGSLSAGVPLVCVPQGSDQGFNSRKCAAAGYGLWLSDEDASPERIRTAVRRVLDEPSFASRARAFRNQMARRPGFGAAISRVEALAAERPASGLRGNPGGRVAIS
jgi:UDP:flavonoid glycosyltransferase YjiC (YdhE family)